MADCNYCQSTFDGYAPLKTWVQKSGDNLLLYAKNKSRSIIRVYRALLCVEWQSGGTSIIYIRDSGISFFLKGVIEQHLTYLMYKWDNVPNVKSAKAEMEYIEYNGRAVSSCTTF